MSSLPPPTPEAVQLALLQTLDSAPDGTLADSRTLVVDGRPMTDAADQILVKAAVDSLLRREVRLASDHLDEGRQIEEFNSQERGAARCDGGQAVGRRQPAARRPPTPLAQPLLLLARAGFLNPYWVATLDRRA